MEMNERVAGHFCLQYNRQNFSLANLRGTRAILVGRDRRARRFGGCCEILRHAQNDPRSGKKIRDCIRIAALLRERVPQLSFGWKAPGGAEFTSP
jgi:hypothetical protein